MTDRKFEITHGARQTSGRADGMDVRGAYRHGRAEVRGRKHPWLPRFFGWFLRDPEWEWHAAEERGARASSVLLSVRWWLLMSGLTLSGLLLWTSVPSVRWVSILLWSSVALSAWSA